MGGSNMVEIAFFPFGLFSGVGGRGIKGCLAVKWWFPKIDGDTATKVVAGMEGQQPQ
jgi:hypothetical protein